MFPWSILIRQVVKELVRIIFCVFICFFVVGCSQYDDGQKSVEIHKINNVESDIPIMENLWGISDGIKVIGENKTEYFYFSIESPPSIIRNKAEIQFVYRLDSIDSDIYESILIQSIDGYYPLYWVNSLDVFCSSSSYGAYFFTSQGIYPSGLDPDKVTLWIFYKKKIFKFEGVIPIHEDWNWGDYYSVTYSDELKDDYSDVYNQMVVIWNDHMEAYRKTLYPPPHLASVP
jgi:hypothetical protein